MLDVLQAFLGIFAYYSAFYAPHAQYTLYNYNVTTAYEHEPVNG